MNTCEPLAQHAQLIFTYIISPAKCESQPMALQPILLTCFHNSIHSRVVRVFVLCNEEIRVVQYYIWGDYKYTGFVSAICSFFWNSITQSVN